MIGLLVVLAITLLPGVLNLLPAPEARPMTGVASPRAASTPRPTMRVTARPTARPTAAPTAKPTATPVPAVVVTPAPTPTADPTPAPTPAGAADLTFSGIYSERIETDVPICEIGRDIAVPGSYVRGVTVNSSPRSPEIWRFSVLQFHSFQSASLDFTSASGSFSWFDSLDAGSITNISPASMKLDVVMDDLWDLGTIRVRGTIRCSREG